MAIRYAIDGDLRFISHHDTIRLFERAFARARLPVRFSEGFNPRPRMSVVLPRSVGVASRDEWVVVELTSEEEAEAVVDRLAGHMPQGLTLLGAEKLAPGQRRTPCRARYRLSLDGLECPLDSRRIAEILAAEHLPVQRKSPRETSARTVDIRPYIVAIEIAGDHLDWIQAIEQAGTVRPDEMLQLLGLPGRECLHRLVRLEVVFRA